MRYMVVVLVLALLAASGCKRPSPEVIAQRRAAIEAEYASMRPPLEVDTASNPATDVDTLVGWHLENPLNASERHGDKWIKVRGRLVAGPKRTSVGYDRYTLTLEGKNGKRIECRFVGQDKEAGLMELSRGQTVTLAGIFRTGSTSLALWPCVLLDN